MKIYAISLIKNEADIIPINLQAAKKWADKIFIFDNGSDDGAWELVQSLASDVIVPYKSTKETYRDSFRQEVFESFRNELEDGDWICFLIMDEFYIDDPKSFLRKLKPHISLVYGANIEYQFTSDNLSDKSKEFRFDKFKYALIPSCEQRFFKYRRKLVWNPLDSLPLHPGYPSRKFIKYAHYQFRNPDQIAKKLKDRNAALDGGYKAYWEKDLGKTWESKVMDKRKLIEINRETDFDKVIKKAGLVIPEGVIKRTIKYIMHGMGFWP